MRFLIEVDVPEAIVDQTTPEEMENMFMEFAKHYKNQRKNKVKMKHSVLHIRDGSPELKVRIQSIKTQGEV